MISVSQTTIASLSPFGQSFLDNTHSSEKCRYEDIHQTSYTIMFHVMRIHYQAVIWMKANAANVVLSAATDSGWRLDGNILVPVMTTLQPIPKACTICVTYGCKKNVCSNNKCWYQKASVFGTYMCVWSNDYLHTICY